MKTFIVRANSIDDAIAKVKRHLRDDEPIDVAIDRLLDSHGYQANVYERTGNTAEVEVDSFAADDVKGCLEDEDYDIESTRHEGDKVVFVVSDKPVTDSRIVRR